MFYATGGSTANDTALRIVQHYFNHLGSSPSGSIVISRQSAYHGSTSVSAALSGLDFNKIGFDTPEETHPLRLGPLRLSTPRRHDSGGLLRPSRPGVRGQGPRRGRAGQQWRPSSRNQSWAWEAWWSLPPGYFRRISEICKRHGILIVADEVVTGFCRLGEFFASDSLFEMAPDLITCAKGLTSGYLPMGATLISREVYEVIGKPIQPGAMFTHGFTYSGHPVCCAAALANIEVMEKIDLCDHVREMRAPTSRKASTR